MKCPECGGAPSSMVLNSDPPKYRCVDCHYVGTRGPWMASANKAHAERLQAARDEVERAKEYLSELMVSAHIARLIDAKVELALLERGS